MTATRRTSGSADEYGAYQYGNEPLYLPPSGEAARLGPPGPLLASEDTADGVLRDRPEFREREVVAGPPPTTERTVTDDVLWFRWITGHQVTFLLWHLMTRVLGTAPPGTERPEADIAALRLLIDGYNAMLVYTGSCTPEAYSRFIRPAMYRQHHGFSGTWAPDYAPLRHIFHRRPPAWLYRPEAKQLLHVIELNQVVHEAVAARLVPGSESLLQQHASGMRLQDRKSCGDVYDAFFLTLRTRVSRGRILQQLERRLRAIRFDVGRNGFHLGDPGAATRAAETNLHESTITDYRQRFPAIVTELCSLIAAWLGRSEGDGGLPVSTVKLDAGLLARITSPHAPGGAVHPLLAAAVSATLLRYERTERVRLYVSAEIDGAAKDAIELVASTTQTFEQFAASAAQAPPSEATAGDDGNRVRLRLAPRQDGGADLTVEAESLPHKGGPALALALGCLLRDALDRPSARIGALRLTAAAEAADEATAQLQRAAAYPVPAYELLHSPFERMAAAEPERAALVTDSGTVSYGELDRRAERFAALLRAQGCAPEQVVGIYLERSVELVVALLAVLKTGAAFVPLDRRLPAERIAGMLTDADCQLILSEAHLQRDLAGIGVRILSEPPGGKLPHATTPSGGPAAIAPDALPENPAFLYYTSGSTGKPKGVVIDHRNAAARVEWIAQRYGLGPGSVVLHKTPLIFDVAVIELFAPLGVGGTVRVAGLGGEADVGYLDEVLADGEVSFVHFVPSMLKVFLSGIEGKSYPGVRWVQTSGEAMPARLLGKVRTAFPHARFDSAYGQTETSEVAVWEALAAPGTTVPVGDPVAAYRILLLDEGLHPVPPGVPGEICVAGVNGLARGYHGRPGETAERFVPNPFPAVPGERLYRTGDLAVRPATGRPLEFLGRADLQTKIRGARVELADVEAALSAAPGVKDCAVLARADGEDAELIAYLVGDRIRVEDAANHAARTLPEYMIPSAFVVLSRLPYTGTGKLNRAALPAPSPADRVVVSNGEAPASPLESEIAAEWERMLGLASIGRSDGFFALGGNSLKAAQMLNRISSTFGVRVPVVSFFRDPTVRGVAAEVERLITEVVAEMPDDEVHRKLAEREPGHG